MLEKVGLTQQDWTTSLLRNFKFYFKFQISKTRKCQENERIIKNLRPGLNKLSSALKMQDYVEGKKCEN